MSTKSQRWQIWWMFGNDKHDCKIQSYPGDHTHIPNDQNFLQKIVFLSNLNLPETSFNAFELTLRKCFVFFIIANFGNLSNFLTWNLTGQSSFSVGWDNFLVFTCWWWSERNFWRWFSLYFIFLKLSFLWWHWYSRVDSNMNGTPSNGMCIRSPFRPFSEHTCGNFDCFNK